MYKKFDRKLRDMTKTIGPVVIQCQPVEPNTAMDSTDTLVSAAETVQDAPPAN